jgi:hypothetical protein
VRIISSSSGYDHNNSGGNSSSNNNDKVEYTPAKGFFGNDEFTYTIVDRNGATDSAKVTVTVNPVNHPPPPAASNIKVTTEQNQSASVNHPPAASNIKVTTEQNQSASITLQATDPDKGDTVTTFSIVSETANGGKISNFDSQAGTLTYTPAAGFSGQDSFTYKAVDSKGADSNTAKVTVNVKHEVVLTTSSPSHPSSHHQKKTTTT